MLFKGLVAGFRNAIAGAQRAIAAGGPMTCAKCGNQDPPTFEAVKDGERLVGIHCQACGHKWGV